MQFAPSDWITVFIFAVGAIAAYVTAKRPTKEEPASDGKIGDRLLELSIKVVGMQEDILRLERDHDDERRNRTESVRHVHDRIEALRRDLNLRIDGIVR